MSLTSTTRDRSQELTSFSNSFNFLRNLFLCPFASLCCFFNSARLKSAAIEMLNNNEVRCGRNLALGGSHDLHYCSSAPPGLETGIVFVFTCILFILLSRESDEKAITSSLRSCQISVYHSKMGEFH